MNHQQIQNVENVYEIVESVMDKLMELASEENICEDNAWERVKVIMGDLPCTGWCSSTDYYLHAACYMFRRENAIFEQIRAAENTHQVRKILNDNYEALHSTEIDKIGEDSFRYLKGEYPWDE